MENIQCLRDKNCKKLISSSDNLIQLERKAFALYAKASGPEKAAQTDWETLPSNHLKSTE
jgi:hypothetical protein